MPEQGIVLENKTDLPPTDRLPGHVLAVEEDGALLGRVERFQPGDDPQQRRLARAGRPQQGHQLPVGTSSDTLSRAVKLPKVLRMLRTSMLTVRPPDGLRPTARGFLRFLARPPLNHRLQDQCHQGQNGQ